MQQALAKARSLCLRFASLGEIVSKAVVAKQPAADLAIVEEFLTVPVYVVYLLHAHRSDFLRFVEFETGVKVSVELETDGDNRKLKLVGPAEAIGDARKLLLEEGGVEGGGVNGKRHEVYMLPANRIGACIGKGGETIKSIQDRSECRVFLQQDPNDASSQADRPVHIVGTKGAIATARRLINEATFQCRDGDILQVLEIPDYACSSLIGKKAENVRSLQRTTSTNIFLDGAVGVQTRRAFISGTPDAVQYACQMIVEQLGDCVVICEPEPPMLDEAAEAVQCEPQPQQPQPATLTAEQTTAYYYYYYEQLAAQYPEHAPYYRSLQQQLLQAANKQPADA